MRKQQTSVLITLALAFSTIAMAIVPHTSRVRTPDIIPYPIDPEKEPIAQALMDDGIWTDDPAKAAALAKDLASYGGPKKGYYAVMRDNYFDHAASVAPAYLVEGMVEGKPLKIKERARPYLEQLLFQYTIPDANHPDDHIPALMFHDEGPATLNTIRGSELRDALALFTAMDKIEKLEKTNPKIAARIDRILYQVGNERVDTNNLTESQIQHAAKVIHEGKALILGADYALTHKLDRDSVKPKARK